MNNDNSALKRILANIDLARKNIISSENKGIVVLVSGSEASREYWQKRLNAISSHIFNSDGSTVVFSFQEKIGEKTRAGNFLGTLLAYSRMKSAIVGTDLNYRDSVTFMGMVFGRGERMSPFTQIEGGCKPAIVSTAAYFDVEGIKIPILEIEESLMFFSPIAKYLEDRGFRGVLDKWGDETEIPAIDLKAIPSEAEALKEYDIIKFVSVFKVTEGLAKAKDWVAYDKENNMLDQVVRDKKENLINRLLEIGIKPCKGVDDEEYHAGISLGPVAVSYDVLDIAEEVFGDDIKRQGTCLDFDPYLLKAFAMKDDQDKWDTALKADPALMALAGPEGSIPDLFEKTKKVRETFKERYGRELNLKIIDLGKDVFWLDVGQHDHLRKKYMSLNAKGDAGIISRKLEGISDVRDANGNIIVNSKISQDMCIENSIVINSQIEGKGKIKNSVVKDSFFRDVDMADAFAILSHRKGCTVLKKDSGLYKSLGSISESLTLEEGMRSGTLLTSYGPIEMRVSEHDNLRDRDARYCVPIHGNKISFKEAYDEMRGISFDDLERRRIDVLKKTERVN